jgi:GGDEF domain-containing protein
VRVRWIATAVLALGLFAFGLQQTVFHGTGATDHALETWLYNALALGAAIVAWTGALGRRRPQRRVWILVATSLSGFALAGFVWTVVLPEPAVSIADAMWLAGYLPLYAALVLCVRDRVEHFHASVWLDGAIAALGTTALAAAALWPVLLDASRAAEPVVVMVNLGYPLADLLMALLIAVAALLRGRLGRPLAFLLAGMLMSACADALYLAQVTAGAEDISPFFDLVEVGANVVMGLAALQVDRETAPARLDGWRVLLLPGGFALLATLLMTWAAFSQRVDPVVPTLLASATLLAVCVRAGMTFGEHLKLLDAREQARTDDLTGLLNRRGFSLACEVQLAGARTTGRSLCMLLLDLDGFKELNDTFGHHLGDEVLGEVGARLAAALPRATLARLGDDEFAALVDAGHAGEGARRAGRAMLNTLTRRSRSPAR